MLHGGPKEDVATIHQLTYHYEKQFILFFGELVLRKLLMPDMSHLSDTQYIIT